MPELAVVAVAAGAGVAAAAGTAMGAGGAVLLVPALLIAGVEQTAAAAAGLLTVAAGCTAAGPRQIRQQLVNHRLAVTLEVMASTGAIVGAVVAGFLPAAVFAYLLAAVLLFTAATTFLRGGMRNLPEPSLGHDALGEHAGGLGGAYLLTDAVVPYRAARVRLGLALSAVAGTVAGLTGTSGGFLKTPIMSEIMHVPVKVAAATTTLASGLTAVAALAVYLPRGALAPTWGAAAVGGALLGGQLGAWLQQRLPPVVARRSFAVLLLVIALGLLARS
jgi:uncharacterized membrane protein YfcA